MNTSEWKETEATVFTCGWQDKFSAGATGLRPDGSYLITFSYEVGGSWYSGEFLNGSALVEGSRFSLRYDPDRPERNEKNLEARRSRWFSVVIAIVLGAAWLFYEWLIRAPSR
jgi:hypothetical protein